MIKVYVRTDEAGRVVEMASSIFLTDPAGWTEIGEGEGAGPGTGTASGLAAASPGAEGAVRAELPGDQQCPGH